MRCSTRSFNTAIITRDDAGVASLDNITILFEREQRDSFLAAFPAPAFPTPVAWDDDEEDDDDEELLDDEEDLDVGDDEDDDFFEDDDDLDEDEDEEDFDDE